VKRILCNKVSFTLATIAILLVGILRDPDMANANDLDTQPVAQEHMPGYQCLSDAAQSQSLSEADVKKLNAPVEGSVPTF
jgi:hypothetical protein